MILNYYLFRRFCLCLIHSIFNAVIVMGLIFLVERNFKNCALKFIVETTNALIRRGSSLSIRRTYRGSLIVHTLHEKYFIRCTPFEVLPSRRIATFHLLFEDPSTFCSFGFFTRPTLSLSFQPRPFQPLQPPSVLLVVVLQEG